MYRRTVLLAGAGVAATAGCLGDDDDGATPSEPDLDTEAAEDHIFERVNAIRQERGLGALERDSQATDTARSHATDMAENDYYSHESPDGETARERFAFCEGGESILRTYYDREFQLDNETRRYTTPEELAEGIVEAWMNAETHRERGLLGLIWVSAGVGIAQQGSTVYAVMGFCQAY